MEITNIQLKTSKGKKIDLSLDEAKELHAQLAELFTAKENWYPITYPSYPSYPRWDTTPYQSYTYRGGVTTTDGTSNSTFTVQGANGAMQ